MNENPTSTGEVLDNDRNPDGTFKPGHKSFGHRPEGSRNFATLYKDALVKLAKLNKLTPEDLEDEMIANAVAKARGGDFQFYRDILDRLHGKATQRIIGDIDVTNRQKVDDEVVKQITQDINELYRRTNLAGDGGTASPVDPQA